MLSQVGKSYIAQVCKGVVSFEQLADGNQSFFAEPDYLNVEIEKFA
jgi:hypothetical protein